MTGSRAGKSQAAFRTISEVAEELDVAQHVLRFWESKFPQVRPLKRGGGRRYYRPEDIELLREIRALLYDEGYTIKGAQKLLRQKRAKTTAASKAAEKPAQPALAGTADPPAPTPQPPPPHPAPPRPRADGHERPEAAPAVDPTKAQRDAARPPSALELERLEALRRLMVEMRREVDRLLAEAD